MKKDKNKKTENNAAVETAEANTAPEYTLDIPEDEIWTYQIEGLQAPHIGKPYKNMRLKQIIVVVTLVIAISLAIYLSVRAVHSDTYKYNDLGNGTYELVKFSNPGEITELTVDYVVDLETGERDTSKPITVLHEYAFNCDDKLQTITIGADVTQIDGKSFYTCNYLQCIYVDENNPNYCDVDGVLYTKDLKEIICYPIDHDQYLRGKYGYEEEIWPDNENQELYEKYKTDIRTYVIPSTVEKIGKLCFNYANLVDVYMPEGVKTIETMSFFKAWWFEHVYSYTTDVPITDTSAKAIESFASVYPSLPEGLEYIGSDAFSYDREVTYVYIPSSVTYIGHHAFWDACYKESGTIKGVSEINVANDKDTFDAQTHVGDQWKPQYDYMLFKKSVAVNYSAERK